MTVAAVMLVKDEADIIEATVRHLLSEVDAVLVADNLSTDGTLEILYELAVGRRLLVTRDEDPGYYQAAKTTRLARTAYDLGHEWVVPCDADEFWYSPHGRIADVLSGLPRTALFARAVLFDHIGTILDEPGPPVERLAWRFNAPGALPKVACRLTPDLEIGMGNHDAAGFGKVRSDSPHALDGILVVRHYPWRSPEQFLRKITNGARAYAAAPDLSPAFGEHWRAFGLPDDPGFEEACLSWFWHWGFAGDPRARDDLVRDPLADALAARTHTIGG